MEKQKQKDKQIKQQPPQAKPSEMPEQKGGAYEELIKEKDKQIADYERRIKKMNFDSMLDEKLGASRAKNKLAVRALMDMDKLSVVDGQLVGADEQISNIKARDGYLFESSDTGGGTNPSGVTEQVDLDALSDREYFRVRFGK